MSNLTFSDVESSWLQGKADFDTWMAENQAKFFDPLIKLALAEQYEQLKALPATVREQVRMANPEMFDKLMDAFKSVLDKE